MKEIGMLQGMHLCRQYKRLNDEEREKVRNTRLTELVSWAREQSPVYRELYKDIGQTYSLTDLPPVTKTQLMSRFNQWITDQTVTLSNVEAFMENPDHIGRKFMNKYLVFTTSGSTGNPLIALCDKTTNNMMGAINTLRSFTRKEDLKTFVLRGGKSIGVFATGGFYLSNSSIRARQLAMPWKKKKFAITSALLPVERIVEQLNQFQPVMLGGYPSNLELLIDEQKSGRLHINPAIIMTGGEYLSEKVRNELVQAFDCYVQTTYSCTEGGTIACECTEHHFHINDDWLLVEPVDKDNKPVPDGVQADKILLTNLYNYTQPFIRYEITDRIVMHHDLCPCGNSSPWLTLEGRTDDVVQFVQEGKVIKIPPLAIYAVLKEVPSLRRFQVIVYSENKIKLRLEPREGVSKETAFVHTREALLPFLASHNVDNVTILLSDELPKQHPGSGKFKHIIYHAK
jgi:phenylacetate-CoA ligase